MGVNIGRVELFESSVVKAKEGDLSKLKELYISERRGIFLFILSFVKDYEVAEDLLHETFIKIIEKSYTYKCESNAKAWILTIAKNLSLSYLTRNKRVEVKEEIIIEDKEEFGEVEGYIDFLRMIEDLNEVEKQIIILKLNAELSYIQISKIMGISILAARAKYSRAIKKLRIIKKDSE